MLISIGTPQCERILLGLDIAATYLAFEKPLELVLLFQAEELPTNNDLSDRLEQVAALGLKEILIFEQQSGKKTLGNISIPIAQISASEYHTRCSTTQVINV